MTAAVAVGQVLGSGTAPRPGPRALAGSIVRTALLVHLYAIAWTVLLVAVLVPFGFRPIVVASASMAPTVQTGDLLIVDTDVADIEPGAVVTFESPLDGDRFITHRVVGLDDTGRLVTKGDANRAPDTTPVPLDSVVGVSQFSLPLAGRPVLWLQQGGWVPLLCWLLFTMTSLTIVSNGRLTFLTVRPRRVRAWPSNRTLRLVLAVELLAIGLLSASLALPVAGGSG